MLANFGFVMSDEELQSLVKTYGNEQNDIQYLRFIDDANPNKGVVPSSENLPTSSKSSYTDTTLLFKGEDNFEKLMTKIKNQIKKDRIRLGEFFQDHDLLRKGVLPAQKFRGVLYTQKLLLADDEFDLLKADSLTPLIKLRSTMLPSMKKSSKSSPIRTLRRTQPRSWRRSSLLQFLILKTFSTMRRIRFLTSACRDWE